MAHLKVSLICTVYNEAESLGSFLTSLQKQSRVPDEFIIVDAGSSDTTVQQLKNFGTSVGFPVRIEVSAGASIAKGRNEAIKLAKHEIIAVTDAGCVLKNDWLEELTKPFADDGLKVVAGWYEPPSKLPLWPDVIAAATHTHRKSVDPQTFLPSSRSIAFRKEAWAAVGGYPEWLTKTAEDTLYDLALREKKFRQVFAEKAIVYWYPRPTLKDLWKQYVSYGYGDAEANLEKKLFRIKSWGLVGFVAIILASYTSSDWRWLLVILLGVLAFGYIPASTIPQFKLRYLLIPIPKITASLAQYVGYWKGLSSPRRKV